MTYIINVTYKPPTKYRPDVIRISGQKRFQIAFDHVRRNACDQAITELNSHGINVWEVHRCNSPGQTKYIFICSDNH